MDGKYGDEERPNNRFEYQYWFAIVTKPAERELKEQVSSKIISGVKTLKFDEEDNFLSGSIKALCMLNSDKCAETINNSLVFKTEDLVLFKVGMVNIFSAELVCFGMFNTWKCWRAPEE